MQIRHVALSLEGFGAPPSPATVEVAVLSPGERARRAALGFGALVAVALIALPIPLVHFVLVPAALIGAVVFAAARLRQGEIFRSAEGGCPLCGERQSFSVMGRYRVPRTLHCAACHRELQLTT